MGEVKVIFNGEVIHTSAKDSLEFFTSHTQGGDEVWILNGFAKKEPIALQENDELFCIKKGVLPKEEVLESMMRARHTPKLHHKLKSAKVAICGLGGLGSHIAIMLARVGVGTLRLIDFDSIEPSNLNRQSYMVEDLGKPKTKALAEQITRINPFITTEPLHLKIEQDNIKQALDGVDIVCEAFDNAHTKAMLAQSFHTFFPDTPLICASGLAGFGDSNTIRTKKITPYLYVCGDLENGAQVGRGLMAPRVVLCAAHQANLVVELLSSKGI